MSVAPTKFPGLTKLRSDSKHIQRTLDSVERILSEPQKLFDVTKCVSAEKIVNDEIQKCIDLSDEISYASEETMYNLENGAMFLGKVDKFKKDTKDLLDIIEGQLKSFGYVKYKPPLAQEKKAPLEIDQPSLEASSSGGFLDAGTSLTSLVFDREPVGLANKDVILSE